MSLGDHCCTPPEVVEVVRRTGRGQIALDPCSNRFSIVGAGVELRRGGLEASWVRLAAGGLTYVNCPYSRGQIGIWTAKARAEADAGAEILGLFHGDTSTGWYRECSRHAQSRAHPPRINFLARGRRIRGNQYSQVLFYWGPHIELFASACVELWRDSVLVEDLRRLHRARRSSRTRPILSTAASRRIGARSFSAEVPQWA